MKIIEAHAGALTNFEVLDHLRSRGAGKDPSRIMRSVSPSEFKLFDYLEQSASCNQTRDAINKMVEECKKFDLAKSEILNVVNMRPSSAVEVYTMIEECDSRMEENIDEFVEAIEQILPPHPSQVESNDDNEGKKEEPPHPSHVESNDEIDEVREEPDSHSPQVESNAEVRSLEDKS